MAETVPDTDIGHGTLFKKKTGPGVYQIFAEVSEFTAPEYQRDSVEFTHFSSPERYREFKPGLIDPGEVEIVYNLVAGVGDDKIIIDHIAAKTVDEWQIEWPNGTTLDFKGFATSHKLAQPLDDKMTGSATFKISGKPVLTVAP